MERGGDQLPVTPINRSFSAVDTDSFVTAILSPSSRNVFAARARARSRSDCPQPASTAAALNAAANAIHYSPSLDSISTAGSGETKVESNVSPLKRNEEYGETKASAVLNNQPMYDSPSYVRRTRLLSSAGAALNAVPQDTVAQLTTRSIRKTTVPLPASPQQGKNELVPQTGSIRGRSNTLSVAIPSQQHIAKETLGYNDCIAPAIRVRQNRHHTLSYFDLSRDEGPDAIFSANDVVVAPSAALLGPWSPSFVHTDSGKDDHDSAHVMKENSLASLDSRYDSSLETSPDNNDLSLTLSTSFSESIDTSQDNLKPESMAWKEVQTLSTRDEMTCEESHEFAVKFQENITETRLALSKASHSTVGTLLAPTSRDFIGRRKSHTMSEVGHRTHLTAPFSREQATDQDVFGPTKSVDRPDSHFCMVIMPNTHFELADLLEQQTAAVETDPSHNSKTDSLSRLVKPRRLTVGGAVPTAPRAHARMALHQHRKPESNIKVTYGTVAQASSTVLLAKQASLSQDQSLTAFQELIQDIKRERAVQSNAIAMMTPAEPESIGAVLEYKRCSPTNHVPEESGSKKCELCGAVARRLTVLEPCGHCACAACCSSGINQVTATPPRPHTCAACHTLVVGITLRKGPERDAGEVFDSKSPHYRPRTPCAEEQEFYYQNTHPVSPSNSFPCMKGGDGIHRRENTGRSLQGVQMGNKRFLEQVANEFGETTSSDIFTEDLSFYQSQRALEQFRQNQQACQMLPFPTHDSAPCSSERKAACGTERKDLRSTTPQGTSIVRVDNIPWTATYNDVVEWLPKPSDDVLPNSDISPAAIHVPVDVSSGKTSNCCFVECKDKSAAQRLVRHRNNSRLLGRPVSLMISTFDELLNEIFPARAHSLSLKDDECTFFNAVHLRQLVELLRRGGAQLKGPLKIVDMTTSMIRLVPAKMSTLLSEMQIVCICIAASQEFSTIRQSLDRLLLACSSCASFTVGQRIEILDSARGTLTAVTQVRGNSASVSTRSAIIAPLAHASRAALPAVNKTPVATRVDHLQKSHISSDGEVATSQQRGQQVRPSSYAIDRSVSATQWPQHDTAASSFPFTKATTSSQMVSPSFEISSNSESAHLSSAHQNQLLTSHREAALQTLLIYGVKPGDDGESFQKMVDQLALVFAKQAVLPGYPSP
ncbi:hypothetical protein CBS101457_001962 [Exobasidium rhododendri]|nr:hypothetical protein CBS101457_001962 [Exobasidium rhododendri]